MKRQFFIALFFLLVALIGSAAWYYSRLHHPAADSHPAKAATAIDTSTIHTVNKLAQHTAEALSYAVKHQFNIDVCFFVDMSMESGRRRFFVYDMKKKQVSIKGLVTHGRCNKDWLNGRQYGNAVGCGCTSPGKYKIGQPYKGRFGLAYKLYGLDSSNSNVYKRFVVLHAHSCVPEQEVAPNAICQSDGCPTVSPGFLYALAGIIDNSPRPVLL